MNKLLPCPFCGSDDVFLDCVGNHWAECNQCESSGPKWDSEEDAITAWNTRHTPEVSQEMLNAAMKAAVRAGIIPANADMDTYLMYWDGMKATLVESLAAAPKWGGE